MSTRVPLTEGHVDLDASVVVRADGEVPLSATERALIAFLVEHRTPASPEALLRHVWGYAAGVRSRTVTVTVQRVRTKIERDPSNPEHLLTVRGAGYRFAPAESPAAPAPAVLGRDAPWAALEAFEGPLLSIVGPGGIGKSHLARAWARHAGWPFVELAAETTASELARAVAEAFGAARPIDDPTATAEARIAGRRAVLDNLEQLDPDALPLIQRWLGLGARLIVTSQRPLGVADERVLPLGPLADDDARALLAALCEAAGRPLPATAEDWLPALGGVPLVLEIAAPLLPWLDNVDDLLDARRARRDGPERHETLDRALRWTVSRLSADAQRALHALGVTAGAVTPELLGAIGGLPMGRLSEALAALTAGGLLLAREPRVDLLPVVRAFARRHAPAVGALRAAHAEALAALPRGTAALAPWAAELRLAARQAEGRPLLGVLARLLEVHQTFGPSHEAPTLIGGALGRLHPDDEARGHLLQMEALALAQRPAEALAHDRDPVDDPDWQVRRLGVRSQMLRAMGHAEEALQAGLACWRWTERATHPITLAQGTYYAGAAWQDADPARAAALLAKAADAMAALGLARDALIAEIVRANALARLQPDARDAHRLLRLRDAAEREGVGELTLGIATGFAALLLYDADALEEADDAADEAGALFGGDPMEGVVFTVHQALRLLHDPARAEATLARVPRGLGPSDDAIRRLVEALLDGRPALLVAVDDPDLHALGAAFLAGDPLPDRPDARRTRFALEAVRRRISAASRP